MRFFQAKQLLDKFAKGKFHSLRFQYTHTGNQENPTITECSLYVDGLPRWYAGKNWYEAFVDMMGAYASVIDGTDEKLEDLGEISICRRCGAITPDELSIIHAGQQIGSRCHCGGELVSTDKKTRQAKAAAERQAI